MFPVDESLKKLPWQVMVSGMSLSSEKTAFPDEKERFLMLKTLFETGAFSPLHEVDGVFFAADMTRMGRWEVASFLSGMLSPDDLLSVGVPKFMLEKVRHEFSDRFSQMNCSGLFDLWNCLLEKDSVSEVFDSALMVLASYPRFTFYSLDHEGVEENFLSLFSTILKKNPELLSRESSFGQKTCYPLHMAVSSLYPAVTELFVSFGASPDAKDSEGVSVIDSCSNMLHLAKLPTSDAMSLKKRELLRETKNHELGELLRWNGVFEQRKVQVDRLIAEGAVIDLDTKSPFGNPRPHLVIQVLNNRELDLAKYLCQKGDLFGQSYEFDTGVLKSVCRMLHQAERDGDKNPPKDVLDFAEWMISSTKFGLNSTVPSRNHPLVSSFQEGKSGFPVLRMLLEYGSSPVEAWEKTHESVLVRVMKDFYPPPIRILRKLLDHNADPLWINDTETSHMETRGVTAIEFLVLKNHLQWNSKLMNSNSASLKNRSSWDASSASLLEDMLVSVGDLASIKPPEHKNDLVHSLIRMACWNFKNETVPKRILMEKLIPVAAATPSYRWTLNDREVSIFDIAQEIGGQRYRSEVEALSLKSQSDKKELPKSTSRPGL